MIDFCLEYEMDRMHDIDINSFATTLDSQKSDSERKKKQEENIG